MTEIKSYHQLFREIQETPAGAPALQSLEKSTLDVLKDTPDVKNISVMSVVIAVDRGCFDLAKALVPRVPKKFSRTDHRSVHTCAINHMRRANARQAYDVLEGLKILNAEKWGELALTSVHGDASLRDILYILKKNNIFADYQTTALVDIFFQTPRRDVAHALLDEHPPTRVLNNLLRDDPNLRGFMNTRLADGPLRLVDDYLAHLYQREPDLVTLSVLRFCDRPVKITGQPFAKSLLAKQKILDGIDESLAQKPKTSPRKI